MLRQDKISQPHSSHQIRRVWNSTYVKNQNNQMHTHTNIYKEIKKDTHYTSKVKNFFLTARMFSGTHFEIYILKITILFQY